MSTTTSRLRALLVITLAGAGALYWPGAVIPAEAGSFTVTSTADAPDFAPGDGRCETASGNGVCTLRAAIMEANASGTGQTIVLASTTYTLTRPPVGETNSTPSTNAAAGGDLDIGVNLTVTGNGAVIDAGGSTTGDRTFDVRANAQVALTNLTIRNGRTAPNQSVAGVRNLGTLTLNRVTIRDNAAVGSNGGGVRNDGTLIIKNQSRIMNNGANEGGGIRTRGSLTIANSTVAGNVAGGPEGTGHGGGIDIDAGASASIRDSTISNNSSNYKAGAIDVDGTLSLRNTTFTNNTAAAYPATNNCDPANVCPAP
jgi:CSLREA domain-containing protein